MKKITLFTILCSMLLAACSQDEWKEPADVEMAEAIFKLYNTACESAASSRATLLEEARYDRLEHYIVDEDGNCVRGIKSKYNPSTSEIYVEGLHEGNYQLLILAIEGDMNKDGAEIRTLTHSADTWLIFPKDLHRPLTAEYFYSRTPFTVSRQQTANGSQQEIATIRQDVKQKRIVGKVVFDFEYNNPYISNAVIEKKMTLEEARFYTTLSGDGSMSGESDNQMDVIGIDDGASYYFMPLYNETFLKGDIAIQTRNYQGYETKQTYTFSLNEIKSNHIHEIKTQVQHPDDRSVVMFLTTTAYKKGEYGKILQDDEPKEVYTDPSLRQFNTAQPLQLNFTDGKLHVRFYSPRKLGNVLIKAHIPAVCNEYFDLAYFDTIPDFADFYEMVPLVQRSTMCHTESGRQIEVPQLKNADLDNAQFKIESSDPYWDKLTQITHGWNIYWGLYGGNPDLADGGPNGNWMGIRPVHCRESVALFLNFTYMIDMPEHEQILRANADKLYDDNKNPIQVEQVLQQMRQRRTLQVGLVYTGNGVLGLGGGSTFGAYQQAWFEHYWNAYSCNIMFHELGHVMGYGHNSSFTYGPWAEELMNNFYVQHLSQFPVDSPAYLNSKNNPNRYQ